MTMIKIFSLICIDCNNLSYIPNSLKNLKSLEIINCKNLKKIPAQKFGPPKIRRKLLLSHHTQPRNLKSFQGIPCRRLCS